MLSAAVRRSSRDLNVMKEKLIFSGKTFVTLGCFVACSCSCSCSSSCSCSCSGSWTLRSIPPFWYANFSKSSFSNSQLKYEEWAFSSFSRPASMSLHPSMHLSECLWMFSSCSSSSPLPCWRSAPVAACVMCTTSCPCHQQCDFFLYSMHPLHPSLPTTPLPTVPLSSFIHPSIHPFMHHTSPINPLTGDYVMCMGAYRHSSLSRQPPCAGGVKGESHQCQMFEVLHHFLIHFFIQCLLYL